MASLGVDSNLVRATAGTSIDSDLEHLHQQGYVVVPSLLSREQIDRIKAEQGAMPFDPFPPYKYDDSSFFERCRVLGIQPYCAPQIEALHLGTTGYGGEHYDPATFEAANTIQSNVIV